jgi:hypothetical protein
MVKAIFGDGGATTTNKQKDIEAGDEMHSV